MIKSIQIKNFKSVLDLSLDLGEFNVLIGENGCGKSNILEAIAFGAATSADKLDYEFLGSRGIRVTNPEFMYSAFGNSKKKKSITINFKTGQQEYSYGLVNDPNNSKKWINKNKEIALKEIDKIFKVLYLEDDDKKRKKVLEEINEGESEILKLSEILKPFRQETDFKVFFEKLYPMLLEKTFSSDEISKFIIYSPEQSSLRKFEETTQIYPLGIRGEGLFQYIKELTLNTKNKKIIEDIKNNLILLDWYEDFDLPENLMQNEFALRIKDKYLYESLQYFDQRSTNEGFLYLLFYTTLFVTKTTPAFFAIDNIDASFNPKLCMQLTKNLAELSKKHFKQIIVTTHNPAILDGLNLKDDSQRLFVISRNSEGHTRAERINYNEKRTMKLSEVWTKGFIGGLPENF
ncbi:MAG: chromosome segregation protein SMC [Bacteroidetes bacterium CG_4_8_14_3_um_filter_31_14]|nr:MAG: chromosome segregation protein SMC [Bacteroidetes bacterium CG_4_8_14_3_um_filter_31_14]